MRLYPWICLAVASHASPVSSQEAQVVVIGTRTDMEARRDFIAGTIVIGRKRIDESGARSVEELLKREPAVTVRDGRIALLNMPGYTQILVDGHPPQPGANVGELNLTHVEQIEILKSSSAQFGPFGIAGTINIISRKSHRTTSTTMSAGAGRGGTRSANLSLAHHQSTARSPLRFSVELSADHHDARRDKRVRQTTQRGHGETEEWSAVMSERSPTPSVAVSGDLTWTTKNKGILRLSPDISRMGGEDVQDEARQWRDGAMLAVGDTTGTTLDALLLPFRWTIKPVPNSQLELNIRTYGSRFIADQTRIDTSTETGKSVRRSDTFRSTRSSDVELSYKAALADGHALKAGIRLDRLVHQSHYGHRLNAVPDATLDVLGVRRKVSARHRRFYLQDEWRISERLATTLGIASAEDFLSVNVDDHISATQFRVWSPSIHLSRKMGGDDKRQLRLSLAKSYKAPTNDELSQRPGIHPLAPCWAATVCTRNSLETADIAGNLQLQPERALALNMSYSYSVKNDSQLTSEIFMRQIEGKHGQQVRPENVPWSAVPRYVARPVNLGNAYVAGVNLEMEMALRDIVSTAPAIALRGSIGLARSRVSSLPGPDNDLDKMTPWTAKLGGGYAMKSAPVKFDLDASWRPGQWTRTSLSERIHVPRSVECDASMIWTVDEHTRLVVSVVSRLPRSKELINEYAENAEVTRLYTREQRNARFKLQFETKL